MAALISTLDNFTPKQYGENGEIEYGWSTNVKEKILQFSFQLVRTSKENINNLEKNLRNILYFLKHLPKTNHEINIERDHYLILLYKMIGHTRDIIDGKGECQLTYMMIYVWYSFYPELAYHALFSLNNNGTKEHPYGSWKDIKYFCNYCREKTMDETHPLIQNCIQILNGQLKWDDASSVYNTSISLVSKWIPREKSNKFGWLFTYLACDYFKKYYLTAKTSQSIEKATLKCKTEYRKLISKLNKHIDTLQIKQCANEWSKIDFDKVTSISFTKQKKAFLNVKKDGEVRSQNDDRIICAEHFKDYINKCKEDKTEIKGKRVGLNDFTKQAIDIIQKASINGYNESLLLEKEMLNSQWRDNSSQTGCLENMIAMADTSGSMDGDPLYSALALAVRVAEKSKLGKRMMTFSNHPSWMNLENKDNFVDCIEVIRTAPFGMNTNLYAAFDLILDAIIQSEMEPEHVSNMVLAIFSDMQIDASDNTNTDKKVLYDKLKEKYEFAGMNSKYKKPYNVPHILFWNLRSTNGFPSLSIQPNVSMLSGFSPALLNLFCEKGIDCLQSYTPWLLLEEALSNKRYDILENKAKEII
jgi:hypothetical protein